MSIPSSAFAGDTITITDTGHTTGSTVNLILKHVSSGTVISSLGVESSGTWTFTLSSAETATAPSGNYALSAISLTSAGVRATKALGTLDLKEPADRPAEETHAAKMVKLLEAHLEGRISDDGGRGIETYTIGGVPITKISHTEARELLVGYRRDVQNEEIRRRSSMGLGTGRRILTKFTTP